MQQNTDLVSVLKQNLRSFAKVVENTIQTWRKCKGFLCSKHAKPTVKLIKTLVLRKNHQDS